MPQQYDNTNRGSLWKTSCGTIGKANIEGIDFRAFMVLTDATGDNPPVAELCLRTEDRSLVFNAGLWRKTDGKPGHLYNGTVVTANGSYWVNAFKNNSEHPKAPALNLSFQEKQPQAGQGFETPDPEPEQDDSIPF